MGHKISWTVPHADKNVFVLHKAGMNLHLCVTPPLSSPLPSTYCKVDAHVGAQQRFSLAFSPSSVLRQVNSTDFRPICQRLIVYL